MAKVPDNSAESKPSASRVTPIRRVKLRAVAPAPKLRTTAPALFDGDDDDWGKIIATAVALSERDDSDSDTGPPGPVVLCGDPANPVSLHSRSDGTRKHERARKSTLEHGTTAGQLEEEYGQHVREVIQKMKLADDDAYEFPMHITRRGQTIAGGKRWNEGVMERLAHATMGIDVTDLPGLDACVWQLDPLILLSDMRDCARRVKYPERPLERAAEEASQEAVPDVIREASPILRRCYGILRRLQRIVDELDPGTPIHPGQIALAKYLGCTQQNVSKILGTLEKCGVLKCTNARSHSGPHGRAKEYRIPEHVDARGQEHVDA